MDIPAKYNVVLKMLEDMPLEQVNKYCEQLNKCVSAEDFEKIHDNFITDRIEEDKARYKSMVNELINNLEKKNFPCVYTVAALRAFGSKFAQSVSFMNEEGLAMIKQVSLHSYNKLKEIQDIAKFFISWCEKTTPHFDQSRWKADISILKEHLSSL